MFTRFHNGVLLALSYVCVFTRFNLRVFVYLPFAASAYACTFVCVCTYLSIHVHVYRKYVYFLLAIREFNPFEINFSFKIINIIK